MSQDQPSPKRSPLLAFTRLVFMVAVATLLFVWIVRLSTSVSRESVGGLAPGADAPPITAAGWLNGTAPDEKSLAGKVVVVEAWASWCAPCRQAAPHFAEVVRKYQGQDVVFIGLTAQRAEELPDIEKFLKDVGATWLNGFGAVETLTAFDAQVIPLAWVIGRDGKIVWNTDSRGDVEDGIEKALAAKPSSIAD